VEQASCLLRHYEQARCLFHKIKVEQASCLLRTIWNGLSGPFHNQAISCGTGILPVPKWHNIYPDE